MPLPVTAACQNPRAALLSANVVEETFRSGGAGWNRAAHFASADTIQLKDKAAVTGKILAEKSDAVVVDVGYTVLVIPRNAIAKISKANEARPQSRAADSPLLNVHRAAVLHRQHGGLARARRERSRQANRRGRRAGAHAGGARLRLFHQRRRLSHHEFSRHRGRDGNFRGSLSPDATASLTARLTSRSRSSPSTNFTTSRCCTSRTRTRRSSNPSRSAAPTR